MSETAIVPINLRDLAQGKTVEFTTAGNVVIPYSVDLVRRLAKQGGLQGQVPETAAVMFINACMETKANPYMREIFLIPTRQGLQPVVSAQYKLKLAHKCVGYRGFTQGWITNDGVRQPVGQESKATPENIIGVWGTFFRGDEEPYTHETWLSECINPKSNSWQKQQFSMLMKCNRDQGTRIKYPELLEGLYTENEMEVANIHPVPVCDTPKRADRKQVDNEADVIPFGDAEATEANVSDPATLLAMADGCRNAFAEQIGITDEADKHKLFTHFVSLVFMCPADNITDKFYTFNILTKINEVLSAGLTPETLEELGVE